MPVEIRTLHTGDEGVLEHVAPAVFDRPIDPDAARGFLADPRHHLVVAVENGRVIGFASGVHYLHPDKPRPELWINEIAVAPAARSRGVGRVLLDALLEIGRSRGCSEVWTLTERENRPAVALYAARGGVESHPGTVMFSFPLDPPPSG